jgi:beta-lactamase superfamily II metal-dependent hydrolase
MSVIHFLNVKNGDCSVIEHNSSHVTVIDVCNARRLQSEERDIYNTEQQFAASGILGNYQQKSYPCNPIEYLIKHNIRSVFRFILTHPDMDHLDGLKDFFEMFSPGNFWDTNNTAEKYFSAFGPYREEDWIYYKNLRDFGSEKNPTRLVYYSGSNNKYYGINADGSVGGDGIQILAPTKELVENANRSKNFNECSYVLLYRAHNHKILFGGDSDDATWDYILENHSDDVADIDILIAPHHGRKPPGRSYKFLDIMKPRLTLFGNAESKHLAYDAWRYRNLPYITNNQAGNILIDVSNLDLYVSHMPFAKFQNPNTYYSNSHQSYFIGRLLKERAQKPEIDIDAIVRKVFGR